MEEEYKTILNIYKEEKIIDELKNFKGSLNDKKIFQKILNLQMI